MRRLGRVHDYTLRGAVAACCVAAALTPLTAAQATPTCFGQPATIVGTDGPDALIGQGGVSDVIYAGAGDDYISGGDFYGDDAIPGHAPDLLCGGPGEDRFAGSPGSDELNGGDGNVFAGLER